jgi:hypothetical protein
MTLKALCVTLGLLGLLSGNAIASPFNEGDGRSSIKTEEAIELFVTCEASFPLLSLIWDDRDNAKAAETASTFLNVPSITPQVIIDRAAECFSTLKSERGMTIVHFDNVQLRCGIGPDINWDTSSLGISTSVEGHSARTERGYLFGWPYCVGHLPHALINAK